MFMFLLCVMSSPAPPALEEGVSGNQSDSESDLDEVVPDTAQPVPVGEKALTDSSPVGGEVTPEHNSPRTVNTQSVRSQHPSEGEGAGSLADPRIRHRLTWSERKEGERRSMRVTLRQQLQLNQSL